MKRLKQLSMIAMLCLSMSMHGDDKDIIKETYSIFDTNATLLQKADEYLSHVEMLQGLLPPATWQGTTESYFEQYVHTNFGLKLSDIQLGSQYKYNIVTQDIDKKIKEMQKNLEAARQCVQFRSHFFTAMSNKLLEIQNVENQVLKTHEDAKQYERFLLGHQIINFYASLPVYHAPKIGDIAWRKSHEKSLISWIHSGYYKKTPYPVIEMSMQFVRSLGSLNTWLDHKDDEYYQEFPVLHKQLVDCELKIKCAQDILTHSAMYEKESIEYRAYQAEESYKFNQLQVKYNLNSARDYRKKAREYREEASDYRKKAQKYPEQAEYYLRQAKYAEQSAESSLDSAESADETAEGYAEEVKEYEQQLIKDLLKKLRDLEK
jgi:hypothetical protein